MSDWTADQVKDALRVRHGCNAGSGQWVCVEEAFSGFATRGGGIDLLAIGAWRTAKAPGLPGAGRGDATNPIVAYEVKVSRSDFRRELYGVKPRVFTRHHLDGTPYEYVNHRRARPGWPHKAEHALSVSHFFMFAVPAGLLKPEELERREAPLEEGGLYVPREAGLVEVTANGCSVVHPAPRRTEPEQLSRHAIAELLRHAIEPNKVRAMQQRMSYLEGQVQSLGNALAEAEDRMAA